MYRHRLGRELLENSPIQGVHLFFYTSKLNLFDMEMPQSDAPTNNNTQGDSEVLKQLLAVLTKLVNESQRNEGATDSTTKGERQQAWTKPPPDSFSTFSLDSGRDVSMSTAYESNDSESVAHEVYYEQRVARMEDFRKKYELLVAELHLVSNSFHTVGGSRSVVGACRLVQDELESLEQLVRELHWRDSTPTLTFVRKNHERVDLILREIQYRLLLTSSKALPDAMKKFHRFHGERLVELFGFANTMEWAGKEIEEAFKRLKSESDICKKFFDDVLPDITRSMSEAIRVLQIIPEKVLPPIRGAEENAMMKYLNMTTSATFFSAITATTLQFSFGQTENKLDNAVNLFWFLSLVFSVSSAINSLLGMTWRKSAIAEPAYQLPQWAATWLATGPMVFLIIAAFCFITGLSLFTFSSGQALSVASTCTAVIVVHVLGLLFLTVWFLVVLKQDRLRTYEYISNGKRFRWTTMHDKGHKNAFDNVHKNNMAENIYLTHVVGPPTNVLPDLEPGNTEDHDDHIELNDMQTALKDKGKAPEKLSDLDTEPSTKKDQIPDWALNLTAMESDTHVRQNIVRTAERLKRAPESNRFPKTTVLNDTGSFTSEDYAYALRYHMSSVHPRRDESFPYVTTRSNAACPRPPSNASRYLTIVCTGCPVPPKVPLPHRGQPKPTMPSAQVLLGTKEQTPEVDFDKEFQSFLTQRLVERIEQHMNEQHIQDNIEGQGAEDTNGEGPSSGGPGSEPEFDASAYMGDIFRSFYLHLVQKGLVKVPSNESISDFLQNERFHVRVPDGIFDHICQWESDDGSNSSMSSP